MSLNCLKGGIKRTDSDDVMYHNQEKSNVNRFLARVETNWSGELGSRPSYGKMRTGSNLMVDSKAKQAHRHTRSDEFDDPATPKLVRSPGIRRDWSFEDLRRGVQGY